MPTSMPHRLTACISGTIIHLTLTECPTLVATGCHCCLLGESIGPHDLACIHIHDDDDKTLDFIKLLLIAANIETITEEEG